MFKHCERKNLIRPGSLNYSSLERHKIDLGACETCLPNEFRQLLEHADYLQDQVILCVQAQAGLRHAEACRLRLNFVDWANKLLRLSGFYEVTVRGKKVKQRVTKNGKARFIPISPALYSLLLRLKTSGYPEDDLVQRVKSWTNRLAVIASNAGVKLPQNALRHGYGSHRYQLTMHLPLTAKNMGTSIFYVENHYAKPQLTSVSEAWFAVEAPVLPLEALNQKPACGGLSA